MNFKSIVMFCLTLPLVMACGSTAFAPSSQEMNHAMQEVTGQDGRACVRVRDISGYGPLNDTTISVSDKFRSQYIMVTNYRCSGLETSPGAAFKGAFTEFCGRRDSLFSGGERCPVQSVFEFENRQAAFDAVDKAEALIRKQRQAKEAPGD
jgi:hypothetical protein